MYLLLSCIMYLTFLNILIFIETNTIKCCNIMEVHSLPCHCLFRLTLFSVMYLYVMPTSATLILICYVRGWRNLNLFTPACPTYQPAKLSSTCRNSTPIASSALHNRTPAQSSHPLRTQNTRLVTTPLV